MDSRTEREAIRMRRFKTAARTTKAFVVLLAVLALGLFGVGMFAFAAPSLPAPTISAHPANPTNVTTATFTYTDSSSISSFQCSIDGSGFSLCGTTRPSTKSYPGLAPGAHQFQVKAVSGSQTSSPTSYSWTIDTTAPSVVSINRVGATPTNASSVSWTVTLNESVQGVDASDFYLVNSGLTSPSITAVGGTGSTYTVTANTDGTVPSGSLGLNLQNNGSIHDPAGNVLGSPASGNDFTGQVYAIDKVAPPQPVITTRPDDPNGTAISTFEWTDTESSVVFQCSRENGPWQPCSSPLTYTADSGNNGLHQFAVRAVDSAGNISSAASWSWKVNNIGFTVTGNAPTLYPGVWNKIPVKITNPNHFTIYITSLTVGVSSSPANCAAPDNIETQASPATSSNTFAVPSQATNWPVPDAYQPQIRLKDLPLTNQDLCKTASFSLTYGGTATK